MLRQLALDPVLVDEAHAGKAPPAKIDFLVDQLRELAAEGHRALVFSQFTGFLRIVAGALTRAGIDVRLPRRVDERPARPSTRSARATPRSFLISLKAGGFGLTLTEADYVFVLDPWWNPAAEAQAIDRAHRIGQTRPVIVYRLVSRGTIEEKVVALQERKRDLFQRVVDEGGSLRRAITADDMRDLLGLTSRRHRGHGTRAGRVARARLFRIRRPGSQKSHPPRRTAGRASVSPPPSGSGATVTPSSSPLRQGVARSAARRPASRDRPASTGPGRRGRGARGRVAEAGGLQSVALRVRAYAE